MNMTNILKTLLFTPGPKGAWGLPAIFVGAPGTAKTSFVEQVSEQYTLPLETVIASLREPSDFLGLPIPTEEGLQYMPPSWASKMAKQPRGVAFLDELSTAAPMVQNALLRVLLDRYVGDVHLPHVRFLAAMNKQEDTAGGGYEMATTLINRVIQIDWEAPSLEDWQAYMMDGGDNVATLNAEAEEERVLKAWPEAFAVARGLMVGFSAKAPHLIHVQPRAGDPAASRPWASRRSWELVARVIGGAEVHGLDDLEKQTLVAGCVGPGAAGEFLAYSEDAEMPAPGDLLSGKVKWKPDSRLDRTMAVLSSCTSLVLSTNDEPKKKERAESLWGILRVIVDDQADLTLPHARAMCTNRLSQGTNASAVMLKLGPVMQAAKMLR